MRDVSGDSLIKKAKRYSLIKYFSAIADTAYLAFILITFLRSGFSGVLAAYLGLTAKEPLVLPLYFLIILGGYYILSLPLNFYRSYLLERRFSLSRQKLSNWLADQAKAGALSYLIGLILIAAFYYVLRHYGRYWWLVISLLWIFFSLILAKLTPTLIIPLFFKYKKFHDEGLRGRIMKLAEKMRIKILDVFEIDFSKKTLKANAAFTGFGKNKRVILGDTLKDKYSAEEIEVILAHEFAHYKLRHIFKLIFVNALVTLVVFYFIYKTSHPVLGLFGLSSLSDLAALPVVLLYFVLAGIFIGPCENYISRLFERNADKMALEATGLIGAFISAMDKLAAQNLADRNPHPLVKFFFFDHPSIDERIGLAKKYRGN